MGRSRSEWQERLAKEVEGQRGELIGLVCSLVRAPSENPPGDQTEVMGAVEDYLRKNGLPFEAPFLRPDRKNIIARAGASGGPRSLILYGHTDVVPAGRAELWSFPPFVGDVKDGWIRGRGAVDMKAGTGACLFVAALFHRLEVPLGGLLVLHANPDEEDYAPEEKLLYRLLDEGRLGGTACIMAEPSGLQSIGVGDKGDLWLRLRTKGRSTHGSSPMLGDSAVDMALEAVERLKEMVRGPAKVPTEAEAIMSASRAAARARARAMGLGGRAAAAGRTVDHTTVNVGRIRGGTMINMVPEECEVEVAMCIPPGVSSAALARRIAQGLAGLAEVEVLTESEPNFTRPDDPVVKSVQRASRVVLGRAAKPVYFPATSDAQVFRPRGIPTLFYGPGDLGLAHALDERVSVEETVATAKILALATLDYLGTSERDTARDLQAP